MYSNPVVAPGAIFQAESFTVDDLYDLQKRQGKSKPSVPTWQQRNKLRVKFQRQNEVASITRRVIRNFIQDFGTLANCLLCHPVEGFFWIMYLLFGPTVTDDIASGRQRLARLRPSSQRCARDFFDRASRVH